MMGGIDLPGYDLDGPVPGFQSNTARVSAPLLFARLGKRENLTLRQLALRAAGSKNHLCVKGSVTDVADQLQYWFETGVVDGFNLLPATVPGSLNDFCELIMPELQKHELFRTKYEGRTLRENLGLSRPRNVFTKRARQRVSIGDQ